MVAPSALLLISLLAGLLVLHLPALPTIEQLCLTLVTGLALATPWRLRGRREKRTAKSGPVHGSLFTCLGVCLFSVGLTAFKATDWQRSQVQPDCEGRDLAIEATIDGLVEVLPGARATHRFDVRVHRITPGICAGPRRLRLYFDPQIGGGVASTDSLEELLRPGSQILVHARLRRPWGMVNAAALMGAKYLLVSGIHGSGSVRSVATRAGRSEALGLVGRIDRVREGASRWIQGKAPDDTGALLSALAVGDRRALTPEIWARLRLFGLTHLMIISGMHITLMAVPGWYLGLGVARVLAIFAPGCGAISPLPPAGAVMFASAYTLISGLSLPAQRALIMLLLVMLPRLTGRSSNSARILPVAGITLFVMNPLTLLSSSFWLSIGAVGLILWFTAWRGDSRWLQSLWGTQCYMLMAMLPLSQFWFHEASSIGGVVNLVAIPLITFLVVPLLLSSLLAAPVLSSLGSLLLDAAAALLNTLWSALIYWEWTLAGWSMLSGGSGVVATGMALLAVIVVALPAFPHRLPVFCLLLSALLIPPRATNSEMTAAEVVFFDVGQGTAVFLRQGDDTLLYDTGGGGHSGPSVATRSVLPLLQSTGIEHLNTLIVSHPDNDHAGGESVVIEEAPPLQVRRGVAEREEEACRLGASQRFGNAVTLRYLSQRLEGDSDNNASCVLLVSVYGRQLLLPGDIDSSRERDLLRYWGQDLRADVILSGHHGSAGSNSRLWLRSLKPQAMIVTAGRGNRFGHPAFRVIEDASASGIRVLNTASYGAVTIKIFPDGDMQCLAARHRWSPFWRRGEFTRDCLSP